MTQRVVGDRGCAVGNDAGQHMIDVCRLNVGRRKLAPDRSDVPPQHTRNDLRVLVAGFDVARQPDVREPIHGRRVERECLVGLLGRSDVDASLDLQPLLPRKLARVDPETPTVTPTKGARLAATPRDGLGQKDLTT